MFLLRCLRPRHLWQERSFVLFPSYIAYYKTRKEKIANVNPRIIQVGEVLVESTFQR